MGNWQLEVAKMAIYMAFPVTSFYVYHQVRYTKFHSFGPYGTVSSFLNHILKWFRDLENSVAEIKKNVSYKV
jgi:hypothetical protein